MRTLRRWWPLILSALLLGSCARTLPPQEQGYGLIAVPFTVRNATSYQLIRAIELRSSRDESVALRLDAPPLNDDIAIPKPLPAGSYVIDYYLTKVVPVSGVNDGLSPSSTPLSTPVQVDLKDGELFVFPLIFRAVQSTRADYIYCDFTYSALDQSAAQYYRDKLSALENADSWRLVSP